jgi:hypothetical protein
MAASRAARLSSGSQFRIVIIRRSMIGVTLPLRAASSRAFAVDHRPNQCDAPTAFWISAEIPKQKTFAAPH